MTFKKHAYIFFILIYSTSISFSQELSLIHVKKEGQLIFFQKGIKSDTITKNKNDLFYLWVPDSLRKILSIQTENGFFQHIHNDTIFKFVYLPGLKYESFYMLSENRSKPEFKNQINGASGLEKNEIKISVFDKKSGTFILENSFFYKAK